MPAAPSDRERLQELLLSEHPAVFMQTFEEDEALQLVIDTALENKMELWAWSISRALHDPTLKDSVPIPDTEHPAAALYHLIHHSQRKIAVLLDIAGHLKDERTLRHLRDLITKFCNSGGTLILIDHGDLPPHIRALVRPFELSLPDEKALEELVVQTVRACNRISPVRVDLGRQNLRTIVRNLAGLTRRQARQIIRDAICNDQCLSADDINPMLAEKRQYLQGEGLLEYVEAPVDLSEIGGMVNLKHWLAQRQNALTDDAVAFGIPPPRGVLMLGVQGAGKSLSAKAVATAWQRPLLRMDPGVLFDRFIGESERRLREALKQAEIMAPVILWIDEIEKGFASAASQSVDGGLSKRMFGTLLTWMQEHKAPVFLIATANDIEALPPELLRKGRFDEIFFIDFPNLEARAQIFSIHLKKRKRDPNRFDIPALSAAAEGYSGAEIEQAIISAMHDSFTAKAELTSDRIIHSLKNSPPLSVTMREKIETLRHWAHGRCLPAD
ncbi:MAG TPA: AAA family ATPase [Tepidisphaeraceae bacterium]|nr:AAA family ATPase [Tepidisphaeraceae bacterium]